MSRPEVNRRFIDKKSQIIVRCLGGAICLLAGILVIQVVVLVKNNPSSRNESSETFRDGEYATTITSCGFVQGVVQNGSFAFLGIQYSVPPTGGRRWENSQLHSQLDQCWNGTYLATRRRQSCWQFYRNGSYDGSEDCLYLDIWTPKLDYRNSLDVVVFIGGDNLDGGESAEIQPSAQLARDHSVVFVSVAIRRSVLGFLSLKSLSQRSRSKSSGNYGISDVLTSLRWIKMNIMHFSGNPESITVLGFQSGSTIMAALLRSGHQPTLFHRLWLSGGQFLEPTTMEEANEENIKFLEYSECETTSCLLKLSPEGLLENIPSNWKKFYEELEIGSFDEEHKNTFVKEHNWLVHDREFLPPPLDEDEDYFFQFERSHNEKHLSHIPIVIGVPKDVDGSYEMRSFLDWNNTLKYQEYLESSFGTLFAVQLFHQYNRPESNHWQQFSSLLSDYKTICPMLHFSKKYLSKNLLFSYITTYKSRTGFGQLASKGSDIKAILGLTSPHQYRDSKFKDNLQSLFYTFVKTGTLYDEKSYQRSKPKILLVDDRISELQQYFHCDLWSHHIEQNNMQQVKNSTDNYFSHDK